MLFAETSKKCDGKRFEILAYFLNKSPKNPTENPLDELSVSVGIYSARRSFSEGGPAHRSSKSEGKPKPDRLY
jgi:hypothetical protein